MLWHGVLVLYDRESDSLWTQLDGRAIDGVRTGERLEHVASVFTTWAEWLAANPDTEVLLKPIEERDQSESAYADYFEDPERLYFPHLAHGLHGGAPKSVVFGVVADGVALAVDERLLRDQSPLLIQVGSTPVLFLHDERTGGVDALDARLAGDPAHLLMPDGEGGLHSAHEIDVGDPGLIRTLRVDRAYWYAWARSHPGSLLLTGAAE